MTFRAVIGPTQRAAPQVTRQVVVVLEAATSPRSRADLQATAGLEDREDFRNVYLEPLIDAGWLAMTSPDRPRRSRQRYRTTPVGAKRLEET